jgi:hypothetical protein
VARTTQLLLVDDLDGTPATERVTFALDGRWYEIDLDEDNSDDLHEVIGRYVAAGRAAPARRSRRR